VAYMYNFQTGNNKIKLLTEYESVNQKVLLPVESILQSAFLYSVSSFILLFRV
jgi:hypothetical protein